LAAAVALAAGLAIAAGHAAAPRGGPGDYTAPRAAKGGGEDRDADTAAIKKATEAFLKAFEKGDPKAVAAFWTPQGEYIDENGVTVRGRQAIAKAYAELFKKHKGLKAEARDVALRFVSRDAAVEEGVLHVRGDKGQEATSARYSVLHVREDGKWLMALVREWPIEGDTLRELEWLVGDWAAKTEGGSVRITFDRFEGNSFIRGRSTFEEGDTKSTATQLVARDPSTGKLRSWVFESDGGFGSASWERDGKRWVLDATATHADGRTLTATNVLIPLDRDTFVWHSTKRSLDGTSQPDTVPVKVLRVSK
jgi:uncharacterized protein (TIGR02246 family)